MSEVVSIPTNNGAVVLVDFKDAEVLRGKSVYLDGKGYPSIWLDGRNVRVHRHILNAPEGVEVDHRDGNPLNARRENLRFCSRSENMRNRGIRSTNTSGYKGVSWHKETSRWRAYLTAERKQIYLGLYDSAKAAAHAHDKAARKYHGEYAYLNFPGGKDPGQPGKGCD